MTYELRIERLFNAPPELVFDTLVDTEAQQEIFGDQVEGWSVLESEIDLRVGGTWTTVIGPPEGDAGRMTSVFTEIDRPHRLSYELSMYIGEWGRTIDSSVTITFEEQDGKTLVTIVQGGFDTEEVRDAYLSGAPGFLDAMEKAVSKRVARPG